MGSETREEQLLRIEWSGPTSLEEAELARGVFCRYVQELLTETDMVRLLELSKQVRSWATVMPLCRPWIDAEVERIKREPPPVLRYELSKLVARDDVGEVVKAADSFATVTFTRAAKKDTKP